MVNSFDSERLTITNLCESDWTLFLKLHTDKSVIALCFDEPTRAEVRDKFESRLPPWYRGARHWLCMVLIDKVSGTRVGITGLVFDGDVAEVGYMLLPDYHGLGFATESLKALLSWCQSNHGITKFRAIVTEGNSSSERVLMRCGFHLAQRVENAYQIAGHSYADRIYGLSV